MGTVILVFIGFGVMRPRASAGFAGVAIGPGAFAPIIPVAPAQAPVAVATAESTTAA